MGRAKNTEKPSTKEEEKIAEHESQFQLLIRTLPKERHCDGTYLYFYQGFWCPSRAIQGMIAFQQHFQAENTDLILASYPKSGTTWLKALLFTIVSRTTYPLTENPLLFTSPHELVPFLEFGIYQNNPTPDFEGIPKPRLFSTHTPYASLPTSITDSKCRIVYICRNPWDQLVSFWHFSANAARRWSTEYSISLEETLDNFCRGMVSFGPFWDHVLGYWKASQEMPNKVLFLKYEDLKEDIVGQTKLLAEFLGFPFSAEEEGGGVVEEVSRLCSFENLKELEVNKSGKLPSGRDKNAFFRKAEVGDWSNYLTLPMVEKMKKLVQEKFEGSGLTFKMS